MWYMWLQGTGGDSGKNVVLKCVCIGNEGRGGDDGIKIYVVSLNCVHSFAVRGYDRTIRMYVRLHGC